MLRPETGASNNFQVIDLLSICQEGKKVVGCLVGFLDEAENKLAIPSPVQLDLGKKNTIKCTINGTILHGFLTG